MPKKKFTKVFTPVYKFPLLSWFEKLLLCEIINLAQQSGHCYASNNSLADLFGVVPPMISRSIKRIIKEGYLQKTGSGSGRELHLTNYLVELLENNDLLNKKITDCYKSKKEKNNDLLKENNDLLFTHHNNIKENKRELENTPEKIEIEEAVFIESVNDEKEKKETPPNPAPPPSLPLWQQAAAALVGWYEANEGQTSYIYGTTHVKDWEKLKELIVQCCAYNCEQTHKLKKILKNPGQMSGMVTMWIAGDKRFSQQRRQQIKKKTGGADVSQDFLNNVKNELDSLNI